MNYAILLVLAFSLYLVFRGVKAVLHLDRKSSYSIGFSRGYSEGVDDATHAADYYNQRSVRKAL